MSADPGAAVHTGMVGRSGCHLKHERRAGLDSPGIGIRIAIGAQSGAIAQTVLADIFAVVMAGALLGILLGSVSVRFIESLLFEVKATDLGVLALPAVIIFAVAVVAALPAVIRAARIDPATMLRSE